jgi:hypothetical protein
VPTATAEEAAKVIAFIVMTETVKAPCLLRLVNWIWKPQTLPLVSFFELEVNSLGGLPSEVPQSSGASPLSFSLGASSSYLSLFFSFFSAGFSSSEDYS